MSDFPAPPITAMPVIEPLNRAVDTPDMTKNILAREWEQHFQSITNRFDQDQDTLASHTATLATHASQIVAIQTQLAKIWPIGSIFISTVATNPATLIGIGTWSAFGAGKFLVGLNAADADFDTPEETGGSKTASISAHTHTLSAHVHTVDHTHPAGGGSTVGGDIDDAFAGSSGGANPDITGSGGGSSATILPPYITCYFWKRTA